MLNQIWHPIFHPLGSTRFGKVVDSTQMSASTRFPPHAAQSLGITSFERTRAVGFRRRRESSPVTRHLLDAGGCIQGNAGEFTGITVCDCTEVARCCETVHEENASAPASAIASEHCCSCSKVSRGCAPAKALFLVGSFQRSNEARFARLPCGPAASFTERAEAWCLNAHCSKVDRVLRRSDIDEPSTAVVHEGLEGQRPCGAGTLTRVGVPSRCCEMPRNGRLCWVRRNVLAHWLRLPLPLPT
jgi:hypothetical protein